MSIQETWEGESGPSLARSLGLPSVEVHRTLGSTSDRAKALAREGADHLTLVLANEQTAGRGRNGRSWCSPSGCGVWGSLVLRSRGPRVDGLLPIRVGLALAAGLEERSAAEVGLKWPNDLFLLGKGASAKVGGILCEKVLAVTPSSPHGAAVVVGVGLNVLPIEVPGGEPSGALASAGLGDRMTVLGCVVDAVRSAAEATGTLTAGELAAWQRRDILRDRPVQVKGPRDGGERGVARGIDQEGRLLVETRYGLAGVVAGTVRALEGSAGLSPTGAR